MKSSRIWFYLCTLCLAGVAACGDSTSVNDDAGISDAQLADTQAADTAVDSAPPAINPTDISMVVILGDSIPAGFGIPQGDSFAELLVSNNDGMYPSFAGRDLTSRFPGITVVDRSFSGANAINMTQQVLTVPQNTSGNTLVIVSIGGNDIALNQSIPLASAESTLDVAADVSAALNLVKGHFGDSFDYPGEHWILFLNVYEPTDGKGTLAPNPAFGEGCDVIVSVGGVIGDTLIQNLALYNAEIAKFGDNTTRYLVDIYRAFLGHGYNKDDMSLPYYNAADPSLWFQDDCVHPNVRGHHEIRRLIWGMLFDD